jgi:hypothetical protein
MTSSTGLPLPTPLHSFAPRRITGHDKPNELPECVMRERPPGLTLGEFSKVGCTLADFLGETASMGDFGVGYLEISSGVRLECSTLGNES